MTKVSEIIRTLEYCKETYGDLNVEVQVDETRDCATVWVDYVQFENEDAIIIRNFPY